MKTTFAAAIVLLLSFSSFAQNPNLDYKFALKGYNQITYTNYNSGNQNQQFSGYNVDFFKHIVGVQWQNKNQNFHEISLNRILTQKLKSRSQLGVDSAGNPINSGVKLHNYELSLSYEYSWPLAKKSTSKFLPLIGFGINPYFSTGKHQTLVAAWQKQTITVVGANLIVVPRLQYAISSRFFADINIPFYLLEIYSYSRNQQDASSPGRIRGSSSMNANTLSKVYQVKVGLGFTL